MNHEETSPRHWHHKYGFSDPSHLWDRDENTAGMRKTMGNCQISYPPGIHTIPQVPSIVKPDFHGNDTHNDGNSHEKTKKDGNASKEEATLEFDEIHRTRIRHEDTVFWDYLGMFVAVALPLATYLYLSSLS